MHPSLDRPNSIPFTLLAELTALQLMTQIAKVLQSKSDFLIHIPFTINLVIVKIPLGGRKARRYVSWKQFKTKFTSIVEIVNTSAEKKDEKRKSLCFACSIVVWKAYADNGPEKEAIRHT